MLAWKQSSTDPSICLQKSMSTYMTYSTIFAKLLFQLYDFCWFHVCFMLSLSWWLFKANRLTHEAPRHVHFFTVIWDPVHNHFQLKFMNLLSMLLILHKSYMINTDCTLCNNGSHIFIRQTPSPGSPSLQETGNFKATNELLTQLKFVFIPPRAFLHLNLNI